MSAAAISRTFGQRLQRCTLKSGGYSLIELVAVLAILSVLLMAVWPVAEMTAERERERDLKRALWEIRDAIDAYKKLADLGAVQGAASGFPPNLHVLVDGAVDHRSGSMIYFLRHVPRDPFADAKIPEEESWGLRSYASSALQPEAGKDVYDIFSKSAVIGLDGTPVSQW
jgi:general secretion pathway protein G